MSYLRKIGYQIIPEDSFPVVRNCSGCGCKSTFRNTDCFRVNANGNKIDVWLIYQCEICKHTYNLSIYERQNPLAIDKKEYEDFLSNSRELSFAYGTKSSLFSRNKAEIDWKQVRYRFQADGTDSEGNFRKGDLIQIANSHELKLRCDRIVSDLLHISRNVLKQMEQDGKVSIIERKHEHKIVIEINKD